MNYLNWQFTWENGRELKSASRYSTNIQFTYDGSGRRIEKNVNGSVSEYIYCGDKLIQENSSHYGPIQYTYDEQGRPYSITCWERTAYYVYNLQGDVVRLVAPNGSLEAEYVYDAWGNTVYSFDVNGFGTMNPFRYRGYYYDEDLGLYYLNSRYYNPSVGRFINADGYVSTGNGVLDKNMFAYCSNNPVNMFDPSGEIAISTLILIGSIVVGVAASGYTAYKSYKDTGEVDWCSTITAGINAFSFCYSLGTYAYGTYVSYSNYKGYTPVTNIGTGQKTQTNAAPYSNLQDPSNVALGKNFTASQKAQIIQQNKMYNKGVVRSDLSGKILVKPQKSMKGITPPANEWQIDHIIPKSAGGTNSFSNAQVLSREENRIKWDK